MHFRFEEDLKCMAHSIQGRLHPLFRGPLENFTNGYMCHFETAFIIMLFSFSKPWIYCLEMKHFVGSRISNLSSVLTTINVAFERLARQYLRDPYIFQSKMAYYATNINEKCDLVDNVWSFTDGL